MTATYAQQRNLLRLAVTDWPGDGWVVGFVLTDPAGQPALRDRWEARLTRDGLTEDAAALPSNDADPWVLVEAMHRDTGRRAVRTLAIEPIDAMIEDGSRTDATRVEAIRAMLQDVIDTAAARTGTGGG